MEPGCSRRPHHWPVDVGAPTCLSLLGPGAAYPTSEKGGRESQLQDHRAWSESRGSGSAVSGSLPTCCPWAPGQVTATAPSKPCGARNSDQPCSPGGVWQGRTGRQQSPVGMGVGLRSPGHRGHRLDIGWDIEQLFQLAPLTVLSAEPVARRKSSKGEKSKSVTRSVGEEWLNPPECPVSNPV